MKGFPGRSVEEIMALAADIMEFAPRGADGIQAVDYVYFCLLPAAWDALEQYGDHQLEIGYSYSTVTTCGLDVAYQIEKNGFIDIS